MGKKKSIKDTARLLSGKMTSQVEIDEYFAQMELDKSLEAGLLLLSGQGDLDESKTVAEDEDAAKNAAKGAVERLRETRLAFVSMKKGQSGNSLFEVGTLAGQVFFSETPTEFEIFRQEGAPEFYELELKNPPDDVEIAELVVADLGIPSEPAGKSRRVYEIALPLAPEVQLAARKHVDEPAEFIASLSADSGSDFVLVDNPDASPRVIVRSKANGSRLAIAKFGFSNSAVSVLQPFYLAHDNEENSKSAFLDLSELAYSPDLADFVKRQWANNAVVDVAVQVYSPRQELFRFDAATISMVLSDAKTRVDLILHPTTSRNKFQFRIFPFYNSAVTDRSMSFAIRFRGRKRGS